jgi:hypothetical protein
VHESEGPLAVEWRNRKMKTLQDIIREDNERWNIPSNLVDIMALLEKLNYPSEKEKKALAHSIQSVPNGSDNLSISIEIITNAMQNHFFSIELEIEIFKVMLPSYKPENNYVDKNANMATTIATFKPWILKKLHEQGFKNLGKIMPAAIFSTSSRDAFKYLFESGEELKKFFADNFGLTEKNILARDARGRGILHSAIDDLHVGGNRDNGLYAARWAIDEYKEKVLDEAVVKHLLNAEPGNDRSLFAGLFLQYTEIHKDKLIEAVQENPLALGLIDENYVKTLEEDLKKHEEKKAQIAALTAANEAHTKELETTSEKKIETTSEKKKVFGAMTAIAAYMTVVTLGAYFFAATTTLMVGLLAVEGLATAVLGMFTYSYAVRQKDLQESIPSLISANNEQINFIENTTARIKEQRQADAASTLERIGILKELGALQDEQGHPLKEVSSLEERLKEVVKDPLYGVNVVEPVQQPGVGAKRQASSAQTTEAAESSKSGATHVALGSGVGRGPGEGRKR